MELNKVLIAPSMLAFDMSRMAEEAASMEAAGADLLHLDVMDGHFVPNLTFGWPVIAALRKHTKLPFDAHLMMSNPHEHLERFVEAGCDWISVHVESCSHLQRTVTRIRELGKKAGVALNPGTSLSSLDAILPFLDYVLVMTVNPGFAGQKFVTGGLERVAELKKRIGKAPIRIEIDGAIKADNAPDAIRAGASMIVSGSGISQAKDRAAAIRELRGGGK